MTTLYMHWTGPLMRYADGVMYIADLNPQIDTKWRMSRLEMLKLGWQCVVAACLGRS